MAEEIEQTIEETFDETLNKILDGASEEQTRIIEEIKQVEHDIVEQLESTTEENNDATTRPKPRIEVLVFEEDEDVATERPKPRIEVLVAEEDETERPKPRIEVLVVEEDEESTEPVAESTEVPPIPSSGFIRREDYEKKDDEDGTDEDDPSNG